MVLAVGVVVAVVLVGVVVAVVAAVAVVAVEYNCFLINNYC